MSCSFTQSYKVLWFTIILIFFSIWLSDWLLEQMLFAKQILCNPDHSIEFSCETEGRHLFSRAKMASSYCHFKEKTRWNHPMNSSVTFKIRIWYIVILKICQTSLAKIFQAKKLFLSLKQYIDCWLDTIDDMHLKRKTIFRQDQNWYIIKYHKDLLLLLRPKFKKYI